MASPMCLALIIAAFVIVPTLAAPTSTATFPCRVNHTVVDCSHLRLVSVPSGIPETTTRLILSHNTLSSHKIDTESFKGLVNLETLDLSYNSISDVRSFWFADQVNLQNVYMAHNEIDELDRTSFDNVKGLRVLDLSYQNNGMGKTSWYALESLSNLKTLSLESVQLTSIKFDESIHLGSLKVLNVASNEIATINDGDLAVLRGTELQLLDLSNNPLMIINSNSFTEISTMKVLNVSSAIGPEMLPSLSQALSGTAIITLVLQNIGLVDVKYSYFEEMENSSLQELDFACNNISKLEGNSFGFVFKNLQKLNFSMNHIAYIDVTFFKNVTSLRVLDLSKNFLTAISQKMFSSLFGSDLEELYLHENVIQTISSDGPLRGLDNLKLLKLSNNEIRQTITGSEFQGISKLKVLDLGQNSEITLNPNAFCSLTALQTLRINAAHLKQADIIPSPFCKLRSLLALDLSKNSLTTLSSSTFDDLISLEALYLQRNNLYNLWDTGRNDPILFLKKLSSLKKLDLSKNGFKNIPENIFSNLINLENLKLGHNIISRLPETLFQNKTKLLYLELQHNEINVVNKTTFEPILSTLLSLSFGFNPFSCSCSLLWFRQWIDTKRGIIPDLNDCKCASPPNMVDAKIEEYHPNKTECEKVPSRHYDDATVTIVIVLVVILALSLVVLGSKKLYTVYKQRQNYQRIQGENAEFEFDTVMPKTIKVY